MQWPSSGDQAAARIPSTSIIGESALASAGRDHPARHPEVVLAYDVGLERRDVRGVVEQEEVADLVQVDRLVELLREPRVRRQAALRRARC